MTQLDQPNSQQIRLLHIIASVDPTSGGPIEGILQQTSHRMSDNYEVHIASLDPPSANFLKDFPVKTFALGDRTWDERRRSPFPWVRYGYTAGYVQWLRENIGNYDAVIVNGLWNFATYGASRSLPKSNTPYVVFCHGMLDPWFKKNYPLKALGKQIAWWLCEAPLLQNADRVLFTTEEELKLARESFWPYRVKESVVGYGCGDIPGNADQQRSAFREAIPTLGDRRYLLFLSRIHPKKGCDLLIQGFSEFAKSHPDLDLVVAGPDQVGWKAELENLARDLNIQGRIHWPGMLTGDLKWGAYRDADAFILPSHQENFGIVVAEAMAAELPVLITDKVNIWREVQNSGGGLVETDDQAGISRLLRAFLGLSATEKIAMGKRARKTFVENFEMGNAVLEINAKLNDAIAARAEN